MAKVTPITEHFQHFVSELKESFWGDLQGQAQQSMRRLFDLLSDRQRDLYMVSPRHSRQKPRQDYRNGYYERDFVTRLGTLRLRIARTRKRGFLPGVLHAACAGKKAPIYRGPERSFCTRDPRILGPRDQLSNQVGENQN